MNLDRGRASERGPGPKRGPQHGPTHLLLSDKPKRNKLSKASSPVALSDGYSPSIAPAEHVPALRSIYITQTQTLAMETCILLTTQKHWMSFPFVSSGKCSRPDPVYKKLLFILPHRQGSCTDDPRSALRNEKPNDDLLCLQESVLDPTLFTRSYSYSATLTRFMHRRPPFCTQKRKAKRRPISEHVL